MSNQPEQLREGQVTPSIDIDDRKDRALIRTAARRRWAVSPDLKDRVVTALDRALTVSQENGDVDSIVDVSKTLVVIESQNQTDDHLADKNERLDQGKLTERVAVDPVILERPVRPVVG